MLAVGCWLWVFCVRSAKEAKAERAAQQHRVSELELLLAQARAGVATDSSPARRVSGEAGVEPEAGAGPAATEAAPHSPTATSVEVMALQVCVCLVCMVCMALA